MDWEDYMLPTINKIQELVRRTRWCGLGFRGPFLQRKFVHKLHHDPVPSTEISSQTSPRFLHQKRKAQIIGTLGLGAHGHRLIQMDELCLSGITSTKKEVQLFIFILISWKSVHYIHKETSSSFHFHPHFMRKCALHPQRNRFIFSFSSSFHEKTCITCTKKQYIFHFHPHFMRKHALHPQRKGFIFSFSSSL
jgi:hypothetical protein